jgi:hypothetical protein
MTDAEVERYWEMRQIRPGTWVRHPRYLQIVREFMNGIREVMSAEATPGDPEGRPKADGPFWASLIIRNVGEIERCLERLDRATSVEAARAIAHEALAEAVDLCCNLHGATITNNEKAIDVALRSFRGGQTAKRKAAQRFSKRNIQMASEFKQRRRTSKLSDSVDGRDRQGVQLDATPGDHRLQSRIAPIGLKISCAVPGPTARMIIIRVSVSQRRPSICRTIRNPFTRQRDRCATATAMFRRCG